ncbi:MAG: hypothetical protein IT373_02505 [Polyangiaceae bacterium]|nr:hypothetical protein [Polyangiaceae bacterium]
MKSPRPLDVSLRTTWRSVRYLVPLGVAVTGACTALVDHALDSKPELAGTGGSAGQCQVPSDCAAPVNECVTPVCIEGLCALHATVADQSCAAGAGVCDGLGQCVQANGTPCVTGNQCQSGSCADALCCDAACDGTCERCDGATPGTCEPVPAGLDPDGNCAGGVCNGQGTCSSGEHVWSRLFGDGADGQAGLAIAVDGGGSVTVAGRYAGTLPVDPGGPLPDGGGGKTNAFLARLDASGGHVWSAGYGSADDEEARAVAVNAAGEACFGGSARSAVYIAGGWLVPAGAEDAFFGQVGAAGTENWGAFAGDGSAQALAAAALTPGGDILLGGTFRGALTIAGMPLVAAVSDGVVARLTVLGDSVWAVALGSTTGAEVLGVASDTAGEALVTGSFTGVLTLGADVLTAQGGADLFVARLDAAGAPVWARSFGAAGDQVGRAIAVAPSGDVVVVGTNDGSLDFGSGALTSAGGRDGFVAVLDASGAERWSRGLGAQGDDTVEGVAVRANDSLVVVGSFEGSVDFGGGTLASAGGADAFVLALADDGAHHFSHAYGSAGDDAAHAVAVDAGGRSFVTGEVSGTVDFGGGALTSSGGSDVFVLALGP